MSASKRFSLQDIMGMEKVARLKMVNAVSGFKSANLIGTVSSSGLENLAVFNSVVHIGANPPLLGFIMRPLTVPRHTFQNIEETGWFTVNHIGKEFYKKAHQTSGKYRNDISEFEACGFDAEYSSICKAPYVKQSVIKIGLTLEEKTEIKTNGTILIVGAVRELIVPEETIEADGFIDLEKAGSICISGLDSYHKTNRLSREAYIRLSDDMTGEN